MTLTQKHLRERLHYDPETGYFFWLKRPVRGGSEGTDRAWNERYAGTRAGTVQHNKRRDGSVDRCYLKIAMKQHGKVYLAHRLAWLYMTGEWPPKEIDHRDGDGLKNRWKNLRAATSTQNGANSRISSKNTTGFKGVSFNKQAGRYCANIKVRGKQKWLGSFDAPEPAHAAYLAAAEKYFGEFARG